MESFDITDITEEIARLLSEVGIEPSRVVLFGSRARGDHRPESDVDILIVSDDFVGVPFPARSQELYLEWYYDVFPAPEFLCLTQEEYTQRLESESLNVVKTIEK